MIPRVWRLLAGYIAAPRRTLAALAILAAGAGLVEAGILVIVVNVAAALARDEATESIELPVIGASASVATLIVMAMIATAVLLVLHTAVTRLNARVSSAVLQGTRRRAIVAFFEAPYSVQALSREGALQESISTLSVQSSNLCNAVVSWLTSLLNLLALAAVAMFVDPLAMVALIVLGMLLFAVRSPLARLTVRSADHFVKANSHYSESVSNSASMAMEVDLFGVRTPVETDLIEAGEQVAEAHRRTRAFGLFGAAVYRDVALFVLVVAVGAIYWAESSTGRLSDLGTVVLLFVRGLSYATLLQNASQSINENGPYLTSLDARLATLEDPTEHVGDTLIRPPIAVELADVSYTYGTRTPALQDVSLRVEPGEAIGIVGPSGGGKTTLLHVLVRLRRPSAGAVLVNGIRYEDISSESWSAQVALVPQEPRLMEASIADNIRFMRAAVTRADIETAADLAHVGDEIRALPDGFDTMLGPRGSGLSGGQRQRVAIARALAGRPQLLALDEPASALDSMSEERLNGAVADLRGAVTLLVVTHRPRILDACDRVLSVRDGRTSESFANHEHLHRDRG
jgi:ATP-binding cassette subfamily B protein